MIIRAILDCSKQFDAHEILLRFRCKMLRIMALLFITFTAVFGIFDLLSIFSMFGVDDEGKSMGYAELTASALGTISLVLLYKYKNMHTYILYFLIVVMFTLFTVGFFVMTDDTFRLVWFFILVTAIFMLHSTSLGVAIALVTIVLMIVGYGFYDVNMNVSTLATAVSSMSILVIMLYIYTNRVNRYEEKLSEKNIELERLASHDTLTGIMNRRLFLQMSEKYFLQAKRNNSELFYFLMMDLDNFKKVNDNYGHHAGDEVLQVVAKLITSVLRENDLFGRLGGEEFGVGVMEKELSKALVVAEKIRKVVAEHTFHFSGTLVVVTLSIGVAQSHKELTLTRLIQHADEAMYKAKNSGKNCVKSSDA